MSAPLITIYVRHGSYRGKECPYAGDEFWKRCNCRKHLRWTHNGKQYRQKAGTRSWTGAEEVKRRLEDQLAGRIPTRPETTGHTLRASYDAFLKGKKVKGISAEAYAKYEREILRLITFCERAGVFTLEALTLGTLTDYKATWPDLYPSSATRALVQQLIRVFLNYCHGAGWITHVPKLDPVKIDEPPTMPLSEEEYKRLLKAVPLEFPNGNGARVRAIIQLMRWSGLAVRDASCLRSDGFRRSAKKTYHVTTERQKTGVHVSVPIPAEAAKDILAGALKPSTGYLFYAGTRSKVNFSRERSREISRVFDRAGIQCEGHMVSHRLRDTFAVDLLGKDVRMEDVSKLLGHKSISTTERHYSPWVTGRQTRLDSLVTASWKKSPSK